MRVLGSNDELNTITNGRWGVSAVILSFIGNSGKAVHLMK